jgi:hypothetical protein
MITIATTTEAEATEAARLMWQVSPGTGYQVFLLGRQVVTRTGGGQEISGPVIADVPPPEDELQVTAVMPALSPAPVSAPGNDQGDAPAAAPYDVMFPVRARVMSVFHRDQIELAARVAFWQQPPDDCTVPDQELSYTWMDDLLSPEAKMIRISGDVIPPAGPDDSADAVAADRERQGLLKRGTAAP